MSLQSMLDEPGTGIEEIASWLDGLDHGGRTQAAFSLDRAGQRAMYERAAAGPAITLDHFVPDGVPDRTPVIHHGRNTLPLPASQKLFQKRFSRPQSDDAWCGRGLYGYNEAPTRRLIGPGYFVAMPTRAVTHIQNTAPGPPRWIAVATPAILPVPTVADSAVARA